MGRRRTAQASAFVRVGAGMRARRSKTPAGTAGVRLAPEEGGVESNYSGSVPPSSRPSNGIVNVHPLAYASWFVESVTM